jgi:DNA-binding IclR family transcriptional regulator
MPSFQIAIEPNRRAAARFVGQVRRALQKAFAEEQKKRGLSQADIARALGVNRSVINRELKGFKDITLGRVAELAWVLGRSPAFDLDRQIAAIGQNIAPTSPIKTALTVTTTGGVVAIASSAPQRQVKVG